MLLEGPMVLSLAAKQRQGELESRVKRRDREMRGDKKLIQGVLTCS